MISSDPVWSVWLFPFSFDSCVFVFVFVFVLVSVFVFVFVIDLGWEGLVWVWWRLGGVSVLGVCDVVVCGIRWVIGYGDGGLVRTGRGGPIRR